MEDLIRTILVDDEKLSILTLKGLLGGQFPKIDIVGTGESVEQGVTLIDTLKPDLVFLDIHMPDGEGFDVIDRVKFKDFKVIFITANEKYALKAFEFSALHYLVKPVTYDGLKSAIDRYKDIAEEDIDNKLRIFKDSLKSKNEKIIIPSMDGLTMVKLSDILRLEADDVYTLFYMIDGHRYIASKPLNNYERILEDLPFSRIHSKHLINLMYIKRYVKGKGGSVIMEDNKEVEVSVRKKADFLEKLKNYARYV
jgi:two-component system LytT family response regulator